MKTTKAIGLYSIIVYTLAILLSGFIYLTGGHSSKYIGFAFLSMIIPTLGVLIMKYGFNEPIAPINSGKFSIKWLPIALFLMPIVIHALTLPLVAYLNDSIPWQSWLTPDENGLYHSPQSRGWGVLTSEVLIAKILINALVGLLAVSVLAFFEEIGWRVWLLPRLIKVFNVKAGVLIGAIIWAAWHIPYVLGGIHQIQGVSMITVVIVYPLGTIGAGIIISWIWLRTQSIWLICLTHGALNNWGQYAFKYMDDSAGEQYLFMGVNGALLISGLIVLMTLKSEKEITS
jgi:membrane protease YdiL (CAAX protease family)